MHEPTEDTALLVAAAAGDTAAFERFYRRFHPPVLGFHLPADQRAAILARVVDERPYAEIAAEMACSEALVRQRVRRGLGFLRTRLEAQR